MLRLFFFFWQWYRTHFTYCFFRTSPIKLIRAAFHPETSGFVCSPAVRERHERNLNHRKNLVLLISYIFHGFQPLMQVSNHTEWFPHSCCQRLHRQRRVLTAGWQAVGRRRPFWFLRKLIQMQSKNKTKQKNVWKMPHYMFHVLFCSPSVCLILYSGNIKTQWLFPNVVRGASMYRRIIVKMVWVIVKALPTGNTG